MTHSVSSALPVISVILATYNEVHSIERCLTSVLSQETPGFDLEVLALDGKSSDGTQEILTRYAGEDPRLRIITNEKRRAPFAFNLGLQEARGEFVCIFGAHTVYRKDYIATCVSELHAHGAAGCGGRVITVPANTSLQAKLVAWAISHPFGTSRKSFRTQSEGFVDTVNYPVMRRDLLLKAGGYDEELTRNQDNDMNERLRAEGYKLYCTWKTQCFYSSKSTLYGLLCYMRMTGLWNVVSLRKNPASMGLRHFIPFIFVITLIVSSLLALAGLFLPSLYSLLLFIPLAVVLGLHLTLGCVAAIQVAMRKRSGDAFLLPMIFLGIHIAYGYGTLVGFVNEPELADRPPKRRERQLGIFSLCASACAWFTVGRRGSKV
jgi:succinoglycan biosynthesis protein ExoA